MMKNFENAINAMQDLKNELNEFESVKTDLNILKVQIEICVKDLSEYDKREKELLSAINQLKSEVNILKNKEDPKTESIDIDSKIAKAFDMVINRVNMLSDKLDVVSQRKDKNALSNRLSNIEYTVNSLKPIITKNKSDIRNLQI